jgi:signal transduction histidine kinase
VADVVYLVDDDPLVTRSLSTALRLESPWEVFAFESPLAALAALSGPDRGPDPDVVISDFKMPGMDGLTLLRAVRAAHPDAVLMLLTGYADKDAAIAGINEVGIWQFVEKPWDLGDLLQKIRTGLERRRLGLELARRNVELERTLADLARVHDRLIESERLTAVGRLASGIAHELGNQLSLVSYAEPIARRARERGDTETLEYAEILVATQRRLMAMVSEIKDFARERKSYAREAIDIAGVVEDALAMLRYDSEVRRVRVARQLAGHPIVVAHSGKLAQVLINLVRNAAQASAEGGEITVRLDEQGGAVVLAVEDHGTGMSAETLARIGEPFFSTKGDRGTGLGLGIARRIVEEHGGTLAVRSQPGEGTTVTVRLPLLTAAGAAGA